MAMRGGSGVDSTDIQVLIGHVQGIATMHGIADHGATSAQMEKLNKALQHAGIGMQYTPAGSNGYGGMALLYDAGVWDNLYLTSKRRFAGAEHRLMLCNFARAGPAQQGP